MKKVLILGIIVLFLGVGSQPAFAMNLVKSTNINQEQEIEDSITSVSYQIMESIIPLDSGNTLYVGGDGPGNYTRIQDAVNNASDGDTVFVYDDSSPSFERISINKSINLVGQD